MEGAERPPVRRGRRILVALLALLLILLPLYLWPLRSGSLPGVSALVGTVRDPRDPAALARIPGEAWDVLMGGADTPPPSAGSPPPNLTMIADPQELTGGTRDADPGGRPFGAESMLVQALIEEAAASGAAAEGSGLGGGEGASVTPSLAGYPGGGLGDETNWTQFGGGYRDFGPWSGGGKPPIITVSFGPGADSPVPTPTPEPATLILVGSNVALLGAAAWKRRRRRRGELAAIG